ncbi:uncharacterized protein LOC116304655 isoform X1 [Actinia tenebrosa]|uniref:Uncharacterized protein LOC116304655 isoform X1 n=1 Tax=Actinia tenebrosa TaxID=6105 RepID=A0A6P8IW27_ACTTE|nr:uncharacterized protein LOC116304655 isoform X1 [Actinia tenebrosa]
MTSSTLVQALPGNPQSPYDIIHENRNDVMSLATSTCGVLSLERMLKFRRRPGQSRSTENLAEDRDFFCFGGDRGPETLGNDFVNKSDVWPTTPARKHATIINIVAIFQRGSRMTIKDG